VDAAANGMEFFVHHEDVRRGEPGWSHASPTRSATASSGRARGGWACCCGAVRWAWCWRARRGSGMW
jgi:hypothetical protein